MFFHLSVSINKHLLFVSNVLRDVNVNFNDYLELHINIIHKPPHSQKFLHVTLYNISMIEINKKLKQFKVTCKNVCLRQYNPLIYILYISIYLLSSHFHQTYCTNIHTFFVCLFFFSFLTIELCFMKLEKLKI